MLRLFKFLYPQMFSYQEWYMKLSERMRQVEDERNQLKGEVEQLRKSLELITEPFKGENIIAAKVVTDKEKNNVILTISDEFRNQGNYVDVYAYDITLTGRQKIGWLYAKKYRGFIKIEDFRSTRENAGIGSLILKAFFQFVDYRNQLAREVQVNIMFNNPFLIESIHGDLSYTDRNHFDQLIPFYKKHGFEISMNGIEQEGKIRKTVKVNY